MLGMAKKKNPVKKVREPAPAGRARSRGDVDTLGIEIDPEINATLERFVETHRPKTTKRGAVEWALEEFLKRHNLWPPPESK